MLISMLIPILIFSVDLGYSLNWDINVDLGCHVEFVLIETFMLTWILVRLESNIDFDVNVD